MEITPHPSSPPFTSFISLTIHPLIVFFVPLFIILILISITRGKEWE
jgi:hypothetical protein